MSKITDKDQRQALKEQIERSCSYWSHEEEVKGFQPSVKAYEKGVKLLLSIIERQLLSNAGVGPDYQAGGTIEVPGSEWKGVMPSNPAGILASGFGAPDNNSVDDIVQMGLFGCLVFG